MQMIKVMMMAELWQKEPRVEGETRALPLGINEGDPGAQPEGMTMI